MPGKFLQSSAGGKCLRNRRPFALDMGRNQCHREFLFKSCIVKTGQICKHYELSTYYFMHIHMYVCAFFTQGIHVPWWNMCVYMHTGIHVWYCFCIFWNLDDLATLKIACRDVFLDVLLMEEILHQLIGSLSHYLQWILHPRLCRISWFNSSSVHFLLTVDL